MIASDKPVATCLLRHADALDTIRAQAIALQMAIAGVRASGVAHDDAEDALAHLAGDLWHLVDKAREEFEPARMAADDAAPGDGGDRHAE